MRTATRTPVGTAMRPSDAALVATASTVSQRHSQFCLARAAAAGGHRGKGPCTNCPYAAAQHARLPPTCLRRLQMGPLGGGDGWSKHTGSYMWPDIPSAVHWCSDSNSAKHAPRRWRLSQSGVVQLHAVKYSTLARRGNYNSLPQNL